MKFHFGVDFMKRIVKWKNEENEVQVSGNVYYLNTSSGNDSSTGLSVSQAWLTQAHAEEIIENGDVLLSETEGLYPKASKSNYTLYKLNDVIVRKQIIADHTIVADYVNIPQTYIDEVKKMRICIAGESHSMAYRTGLQLLEDIDSKFAVNITESGTPEEYTTSYLRSDRATWGDVSHSSNWYFSYGEEDWYTSETAISRTKAGIDYIEVNNRACVFGFGWCWDMTWHNAVTGTKDSTYNCGWSGSSVNGPQGDLQWGLDADDYAITGNTVCMDTYLSATQEYVDYCNTNNYDTVVIFTTGPVDGSWESEGGWQRHIKHEYIREYVSKDATRILFDYADILCYDNDGSLTTCSWNGNTYPYITEINEGDEDVGHIGEAGALRLGKALWWLLARIAGWDGN